MTNVPDMLDSFHKSTEKNCDLSRGNCEFCLQVCTKSYPLINHKHSQPVMRDFTFIKSSLLSQLFNHHLINRLLTMLYQLIYVLIA